MFESAAVWSKQKMYVISVDFPLQYPLVCFLIKGFLAPPRPVGKRFLILPERKRIWADYLKWTRVRHCRIWFMPEMFKWAHCVRARLSLTLCYYTESLYWTLDMTVLCVIIWNALSLGISLSRFPSAPPKTHVSVDLCWTMHGRAYYQVDLS